MKKDYPSRDCTHCKNPIPKYNREGRWIQEAKYKRRKYCLDGCRSEAYMGNRNASKARRTIKSKGEPYPEKRQCDECKEWFGRRYYNSGQIEPPCNFNRRTTCGKRSCIQGQRRRKAALAKEAKVKTVETIDLFIYGERAIRKFHELSA